MSRESRTFWRFVARYWMALLLGVLSGLPAVWILWRVGLLEWPR